MSLDLFQSDLNDRASRFALTTEPQVGVFDGFLRGTGMGIVRNIAVQGVAKPLALITSLGAMAYDNNVDGLGKMADGTSAIDRHFKMWDEVIESATDYWTPKRGEVGMAGQITGDVLGQLGAILASPMGALPATFATGAMDLSNKGVGDGRAIAASAIQTAGLATGIWMPILGQNLWQRVLVGGAGFNVLQGVVTRGAMGDVLEGLPVAEEFKALDLTGMTIDAVLGMGFGTGIHYLPQMREARAQGKEAWQAIEAWAKGMTPEQIAALAVLREAEHTNVDSTPGRPATAADLEAHVEKVKTALEQIQRGEGTVRDVQVETPEQRVFTIHDRIEADGPEDIRVVRSGADTAVIDQDGHLVDITAMLNAGFTVERAIAQTFGEDTSGKNVVAKTAEPFLPDPERLREMEALTEELNALADRAQVEELTPLTAGHEAAPAPRPLLPDDVAALPLPAQADAIGGAVAGRLRELGMAPDQAEANGAIWRAFFRTASDRYAIPPAELMRMYGLDISRFEGPRAGALAQDTPAYRLTEAFAGADEMFRYPRVASKALGDIVTGIDKDLDIKVLNMRDVGEHYGPAVTKVTEIRAEDGSLAEVVENNKGEIWLNIGGWKRGGGGSAVYAAVGNYAFNNKLRFIGDPNGLSTAGMYRRTEAMLSSALKFGTTEHLEPHPLQLKGAEILGIQPMKWKAGDHEGNILSLLQATYGNVAARLPAIERIRYDTETRQFVDTDTGKPVGESDFRLHADQFGGAGAANAGSATLKRAALAGTILRAHGKERSGLLAEILRQSREGLAATLDGIYYQDARTRGPTFYSALERAVETNPTKAMPAQGWRDWLKNLPQKGVKADEIKWSGIEEWLELQQGRVTKEQVAAYLQQNGVKVTETTLGGKGERTLTDPQIAPDVRSLREAGFEAIVNEQDTSVIAFKDEETGEYITADEIRDLASKARANADAKDLFPDTSGQLELEARVLEGAARTATRIERYWGMPRAQAPAPDMGPRWVEISDNLESQGWTYRTNGPLIELGRQAGDGMAVDRWVTIPENPNALPEVEGLSHEVLALGREMQGLLDEAGGTVPAGWAEVEGTTNLPGGAPTKYGQYVLPGAKEGSYRELLLTLPPKEQALPPGYRVEKMAPDDADMNALIDEYKKWERERGYDPMSADEALAHAQATQLGPEEYPERAADIRFLKDFLKRWDDAQEKAQAIKYTLVRPDGSGTVLRDLSHDATPEEAMQVAVQGLTRAGIIPKKSTFKASHFEQENILAHVRFNERAGADGERVLFIEEIQSDWAQQGKKKGFVADEASLQKVARDHDAASDTAYAAYTKLRDLVRPRVSRDRANAGDELLNKWFEQVKAEGTRGLEKVKDDNFLSDQEAAALNDWVEKELRANELEAQVLSMRKENNVPSAPFVGKTDAWVGLTLKRMIRYAAENGFDRVAWTTGEQQVGRYTSALRKAVDQIEWTKTPEGVQLVGYKGKGPSPQRLRDIELRLAEMRDAGVVGPWTRALEREETELKRERGDFSGGRQKVVDTTEKEDVLSDAIGKAMADRIIKDPNQSGTIEGEGIKIDDTGMASFYDRIVPNVAKDILKKLGGGKITETGIDVGGQRSEHPVVRPVADHEAAAPKPLKPMGDDELSAYGGSESFRNGDSPIIGEETIKIDGVNHDVVVIADRNGIHLMGEFDGENFELMIPKGEDGPWTARSAQDLWELMLRSPRDLAWQDVQLINGEVMTSRNTSKQLSFEVTPAMREKAMSGQPLFQPAKGQIQFAGNRTIIDLFKNADASTFPHETGHLFLEITKDLAMRPDAPDGAVQDWATLAGWLKVEGGQIPREAHEQFARGFEAYLREGNAPSEELRSVFQRFRDWLLEVYHSIAGLRVELNDDVRGVIDRMLVSQREDPSPTPTEGPQAQRTASAEPPPPPGEAGAAAEPARPEADAGPREPRMTMRQLKDAVKPGPLNLRQREAKAEIVRREEAGEAAFGRDIPDLTDKQLAQVLADEKYVPALRAEALLERDRRIERDANQATILQDPGVRSELEGLANEAGWEQIGGRYDAARAAAAKQAGETGVVAFTEWIPRADWWPGRPDGMSEAKTRAAVKKALAGEPLGAAEKRMVGFLIDIAHDRLEAYKAIPEPEVRAIEEDWALDNAGAKATPQDTVDADLTARAAALDEAAVERAAMAYENDPAGFLAAMRSIIDAHEDQQVQAAAAGRQADQRQAGEGATPGQAAPAEGAAAAPAGEGTPEPASARKQSDPVKAEAERFVASNPDMLLRVGTNPDGTPIVQTTAEYLAAAREATAGAMDDVKLLEIAAGCLLGGR